MNAEIETIQQRLLELERQCARSDERCREMEARSARSECRLRVLGGLALAALAVALFASPGSRAAAQSGYGATIQSLIDKTQYITCSGGEMYIRNTNLHIENGLGATNGLPGDPFHDDTSVTNGKGNLIIGYNGSRVPFGQPDLRTGSHNLVLGDVNNYSSFGGLVAGQLNALTAPYCSVSGGIGNKASGLSASVTGGQANVASGAESSVTAGFANTASGAASSVSGGDSNAASGNLSSVSGGVNHFQASNFIWQGGPYSGQ
jgi:hypothetical protein